MKITVDVEKPEPEEEPYWDDVKWIKVTVARYYAVECKGEQTAINGWPMEQVIKDWFEHHDINSRHATRDHYQIGGGEIIEKTEIITLEDYRRDHGCGGDAAVDSADDSNGTPRDDRRMGSTDSTHQED